MGGIGVIFWDEMIWLVFGLVGYCGNDVGGWFGWSDE